jgi:hypothetical protein
LRLQFVVCDRRGQKVDEDPQQVGIVGIIREKIPLREAEPTVLQRLLQLVRRRGFRLHHHHVQTPLNRAEARNDQEYFPAFSAAKILPLSSLPLYLSPAVL